MRRLLLAFALLVAGVAQADVRPFVAGSLAQIEQEHRDQPFILGLWSATCTHCPAELQVLGALAKRHPQLRIVLVATDTPAEAAELQRLAASHGLAGQAQWVFADAQPERLRHEIDRRWYGELPRTYFYDRQHRRNGRSGVVPAGELERWIDEHVK